MSTRTPAVAGQFYPASPSALRSTVYHLLDSVEVAPAPGAVQAMVVPHAGYPYSGFTAAHAFARVRGKRPERVVLLGRSHRYAFDGASIALDEEWETPFGRVRVDVAFGEALAERIGTVPDYPHAPEHGLEVEVPFLQVVLEDAAIVPVLFGSDPDAWHEQAGQTLAEMLSPEDIVLISTDLSHFLDQSSANALDEASIKRILSRDYRALIPEAAEGQVSMCGATAVVAGMACTTARGAEEWRLWDYRTSADASGDYGRVVGYAAMTCEVVDS